VEFLKKKLNLTDEQATTIQAILQKSIADGKALWEDLKAGKIDKQTFGQKRKELIESTMTAISSVLTPDQQTVFKEMLAKAKTRFEEWRKNGPDGRMFVTILKKQLNLTDEQTAAIKQIMKDEMAKFKEGIKENRGDKEKMKAFIKSWSQDRDNSIKAALTPEQQTKYDELVAKWQKRIVAGWRKRHPH